MGHNLRPINMYSEVFALIVTVYGDAAMAIGQEAF
jgi:hypothetical protein